MIPVVGMIQLLDQVVVWGGSEKRRRGIEGQGWGRGEGDDEKGRKGRQVKKGGKGGEARKVEEEAIKEKWEQRGPMQIANVNNKKSDPRVALKQKNTNITLGKPHVTM
jgi:hypothetical protein